MPFYSLELVLLRFATTFSRDDSGEYLGLADGWLFMMAGDVMEPDTVIVEVVEDCQAPFVSLPVIRLRSVGASCVGPVDVVVPPAAGPSDVTSAHLTPSPEVPLPVSANQTQELILFLSAID